MNTWSGCRESELVNGGRNDAVIKHCAISLSLRTSLLATCPKESENTIHREDPCVNVCDRFTHNN